MNPAVPVIILDDDEDDDVQITEVRRVQHRKHQQEDGTKAVRDKENLGGCRQSLSLSNGEGAPDLKGPEQTRRDRELVPYRNENTRANRDTVSSPELSVIPVKNIGTPIEKELQTRPQTSVIVKRKRSQSPDSVRKNQRLSTQNCSYQDDPQKDQSFDQEDHLTRDNKVPTSSGDVDGPYTAKFFIDMVDTIANLFPFKEFARDHNCTTREVSRAISAVVVSPLMNPDLEMLQDRCRNCFAENGRNMINKWEKRYMDMIRTSNNGLDGACDEKETERDPKKGASEDKSSAAQEDSTIESEDTKPPRRLTGIFSSVGMANVFNTGSPSLPTAEPHTLRQAPLRGIRTGLSLAHPLQVDTSRHTPFQTAGPQSSGPARRWVKKDCFGTYVDISPPDSGPLITVRIPPRPNAPRLQLPRLRSNFAPNSTYANDSYEARVNLEAEAQSREISSGGVQSATERNVSGEDRGSDTTPEHTAAESMIAGFSSLDLDSVESRETSQGG